jgi:hypothetical protein
MVRAAHAGVWLVDLAQPDLARFDHIHGGRQLRVTGAEKEKLADGVGYCGPAAPGVTGDLRPSALEPARIGAGLPSDCLL